ncbi:hypothetical protein [Nannocystis punicea]|uniref:Lipoprotein n=1 Tax=Nannocystis punicea TaxID=2995304 RepID=A0ABY7HDU2_9BACT|nr:hypothetical protein [Nannocystis poenicansa]WAS97293.1 hypothetical protein O0S08_14185 [Nannocystis poenicansa]
MNRSRRGLSAPALWLALAACGGGDDGEQAAVAACAAAESTAACEAVTGSEYRCAWVRSVVVTGNCETADELRCVPFATPHAGPPACLPIPGCQASQPGQPGRLIAPGFREEAPGVAALVDVCFQDALGYESCESGEAAAAAHPACACVCDPAP